MTSLTLTPHLTTTPCRATLDVQREDIRFGNIKPGLVWLEVEVHNRGTRASMVAPMEVRVAPFGAFVTSKTLDALVVPSIPAGSSTIVRTLYQDDGNGNLSRTGAAGRRGALELDRLRRQQGRQSALQSSTSVRSLRETVKLLLQQLEPDSGVTGIELVDEVLSRTARFAGNFDVHIGGAEAERHISSAIQLVPGKRNVAMFIVGERSESFVFDLQGEAAGWEAGLFRAMGGLCLGTPQLLHRRTPIFISVTPPAGTTKGLLAVGVTREETGQRALVEFGFGVDTIPPGCFRS
jgi:hypothetical protein